MLDANSFKKQLERLCGISAWNPTPGQLAEIARRFATASPKSVVDAAEIIQAVYPGSIRRHVMEGVDNSDLRALLALAIASAKS